MRTSTGRGPASCGGVPSIPQRGLGRPRGRPDDDREEAREFLTKALAEGPRLVKELEDEAGQEGITKATLRRAKKDVGVLSFRHKVPGDWWWRLGFEFGGTEGH